MCGLSPAPLAGRGGPEFSGRMAPVPRDIPSPSPSANPVGVSRKHALPSSHPRARIPFSSNVFFSGNRFRRTSRTTSGCRASPAGRAVLRCAVVGRLRDRLHHRHAARRRRGRFGYALPIGLVIASLLAIVAFSYRQTIYAYPTGAAPTASRRRTSDRISALWRRRRCSSTTR